MSDKKHDALVAGLQKLRPSHMNTDMFRDDCAKEFTAAMVSTIRSGEDYDRLKFAANQCGLTLSQWIARDAVKQADALIAALEPANAHR